jgi:DEAD/DEAH box helicase domain-containing protein
MSLDSLIHLWRTDPKTAPNFPIWQIQPARAAQTRPLPGDMPGALREVMSKRGINVLYSHQLQAWDAARAGKNIVLATGTASGKTLAYNLPVMASLLAEPSACALYLFPTKALSQDQLSALGGLNVSANVPAAIYDGDTPQGQRSLIRKSARIILSNPDMLHTGILPHHTNWADFFRGLRFVVIDEMHSYRGVFGSHIANLIRRLKRVANFYGAQPQFILTSATIGNPQELAGRLIEAPVELIDQDGSSRGERHFLLYNPPVIDEALGLRKSSLMESVRLAQDLLASHVQAVIFARSRRSVEMMLTYLQGENRESRIGDRESSARSRLPNHDSPIRGYRSGYLPSQRREIEQGLRSGMLQTVVATNALELGIDIGGLGAALLVGYPGSIASVYQQSGRAGRGETPALSVLVASANPLDQFLAHHPDYFFGKSPEQALINPDHLLILLNHLRCALFELPFQKGEGFGSLSPETVEEVLEYLSSNNEVHTSQDKYFWMSDAYPAANISLRSASPESVVLQTTDDRPQIIGQVDLASAYWMIHPSAIYIHEGQQYFVHDLNLEKKVATLTAVALDYYTEAQQHSEIQVLTESELAAVPGGEKGWGEIRVTSQVVGFKKLRWFTQENLGEVPLDMPPTELQTTGYWLTLSNEAVDKLRSSGAWTNDPNDYGPNWPRLRLAVRTRDGFRCQVCGTPENGREHDVHHKVPFRTFTSLAEANRMDNLVTLCPTCHHKAEQNVRIRSGLAGLSYVLSQLAPLFLMCDPSDLGSHTDAAGTLRGASPSDEEAARPSVVLYDQVPAGIGFSQKLYEMHDELIARGLELVAECECKDGCPSCVGPGGENGVGGKQETVEILQILHGKPGAF